MNADLWVFGYGSLMWNPGFPHLDAQPALLRGYHRSFCVRSIRYRGTPNCPGLVLGLDRGGACRGRAFRVAAANAAEVLAYLEDREMLHKVYERRTVPLALPDRRIAAEAFVVDRSHSNYCGGLPQDQLVDLILQGEGIKGPCIDYLLNTVAHLDEMGIGDGPLHRLRDAVQERLETTPRRAARG